MCRGKQVEPKTQNLLCKTESNSVVICNLCDSEASLYCQADDAYLCKKCDKWVHGANFLAQRHIRCILCDVCRNLTHRYVIGADLEVNLPIIFSWPERRFCSSDDDDGDDGDDAEENNHGTPKMPFLFL